MQLGNATSTVVGVRLYDILPLDEVAFRAEATQITATFVLVGVVCLGLVLSAAGIFSLMSLSVTRRTREIGVRAALGATPRRLLTAVFSRAAAQIGAGIVAGNVPLVLFAAVAPHVDLFGNFLLGLLATSATMLVVGLLACVVPARRALRIQPTEALREA